MSVVTLVNTATEKVAIQKIEIPYGILTCELRHKIGSTEGDLSYTGPKIPRDEWHRMMSFFRWVNKEHRSECQVRGFIDPIDKTVRIWAFPQEARTGMEAREVDNDDSKAQRAALPNSDKLIYFLTVHHHCSAGAFQSGGDQNNEVGQDGLHITMGNMDAARHTIDTRLYLSRLKFSPNMARFWDIGEITAACTPEATHDAIARHQMCQVVEMEFPEKWKSNLIEKKYTTTYRGGLGYSGGESSFYYGTTKSLTERLEDSAEKLIESLVPKVEFKSLVQIVSFLKDSIIMDAIHDEVQACKYDGIDTRNLIRNMDELLEDEAQDPVADADGSNSRKNRKRRKNRGGNQNKAGGNGSSGGEHTSKPAEPAVAGNPSTDPAAAEQ